MGDFGRGGDSFRPGLEDFMGRASVMGSPPTAFHNQNSDPFFFTDCVNICTRGGAPGDCGDDDHEHGGGEEHTTMNDETPSTSS
jgi:hypothetical protein